MNFVIVTGLSGAGKSVALKMLEDLGYFCVDNLPLPLAEKFAELSVSSAQEYNRVALGIDARTVHDNEEVEHLIGFLRESGNSCQILYLDASDATLIKRYKETRRSHPLARDGRIEDGVELERALLAPLREQADYIIDTTQLLTRDLRAELEKIFVQQKKFKNLFVTVMSFGFKHGVPRDADLVFDVRFLPNPYYVEELRHRTGNEKDVQDYVMQGGLGEEFERRWFELIDFLLPNYIAEGKTQLVIAVGCTGGRHRSVTMANRLYAHLGDRQECGLRIEHRDIGR